MLTLYITESQYQHRIAIRSSHIDFLAALGFPGNKYVYTLVSFFFFFHAIDRYIYIYSLLGKRIPAAAAKSFTPFLCVLLCISASLMVESGSVRKELLSLSFCYVYFGAILFAGAKQTPLFFLYIQSRDCMLYIVCFFICCWLYTAPGWWIVSISKRKTKNLCSSYYYIADAVGYIDRIHLRDICGRKKQTRRRNCNRFPITNCMYPVQHHQLTWWSLFLDIYIIRTFCFWVYICVYI